jgi:hypothetical protein
MFLSLHHNQTDKTMKKKLEQLTDLYKELKQFVIDSTEGNPLFLFHFKDGVMVDPETGEEMGSFSCCGYTEDNSPLSGLVHKVEGDNIFLYITNGGYDTMPDDDDETEDSMDMEVIGFDDLTLSSQQEIIEKLIERSK